MFDEDEYKISDKKKRNFGIVKKIKIQEKYNINMILLG